MVTVIDKEEKAVGGGRVDERGVWEKEGADRGQVVS